MNGPQKDAENDLTAFSLDDVHGDRDMARRIGWTFLLCAVVVAVGIGLFWAWRAGQ